MNSLRLNEASSSVRQRGSSRTPARCAAASSALRAPQALGSMGTMRQPASSSSSRCELRRELRARGRLRQRGSWFRNTRPEAKRAVELDARLFGDGAQELLGRLQQQAAAVAGFAVRGDGATMGQAVERGNGRSAPASGSAGRRGWRSGRTRNCRVRSALCRVPMSVAFMSWPFDGADARRRVPAASGQALLAKMSSGGPHRA